MICVKSKVFVSCGQHSESERAVARDIRLLLERLGFAVYVAVDVQTVLEINQRIIGELKNSDYYLFINFCRDSGIIGEVTRYKKGPRCIRDGGPGATMSEWKSTVWARPTGPASFCADC